MRIAFVDLAAWDYTVDAPASVPLGGSQSALCYLAKELARLGHQVSLVNRTTRVRRSLSLAANLISPSASSERSNRLR